MTPSPFRTEEHEAMGANLAQTSPVAFLWYASALITAAHPHPLAADSDTPSAREALLALIHEFTEAKQPETNASLVVWSEMMGDPLLRQRIRAVLKTRNFPEVAGKTMPTWLAHVPQIRVTGVASVITAGTVDELFLVELGLDTHSFMLVCRLEHRALVTSQSLEFDFSTLNEFLDRVAPGPQHRLAVTFPGFGDARTRLREAMHNTDRAPLPPKDPDWRMMRPMLEWVLRLLPEDEYGNTEAGDPP